METESTTELRTRRRRWFGGLCLLGAIAMLVLDEIALKGRLSAVGFLCYWLVCLVLTVLAIFAALADLRAVRTESRRVQRDLVMETLRDIEKDKRARHPDNQGGT
jgi:hypothetical protein